MRRAADLADSTVKHVRPAAAPLLEVVGVGKRFPGVVALDDVALTLAPGEVLGLVGENGAGKSTLMKVLAGVHPPDTGQVRIDGAAVRIDSVQRATRLGIALIHQELNLADNLSVGANVFLGREPTWGPRGLGLLDHRRIRQRSAELLRRVGLAVDPRTPVHRLSIGRQQLVEIAKALSADARVLIMDEPTSSLSHGESETLFGVIEALRNSGVAVVYISHRLGEVVRLADRVTVLRDGRNAGELAGREITHDAMVARMVGRDVVSRHVRTAHTPGAEVLRTEALRTPAHPQHAIDLSVRRGEIVGVAGLVGAGRTELLTTLFGVTPAVGGRILIDGEPVALTGPRVAIAHGMALVPEDRRSHGLVVDMAVRRNVGLPGLARHARGGVFLDHARERADTAAAVADLGIRIADDRRPAALLSGGNQQKVVLGKWLALGPKILLLDEPTRGIDVGAKDEIYRQMDRLAADGLAILFVSSELDEILGLADRVLVMHEGRLSGVLTPEQASEEAVMGLATGSERTREGERVRG